MKMNVCELCDFLSDFNKNALVVVDSRDWRAEPVRVYALDEGRFDDGGSYVRFLTSENSNLKDKSLSVADLLVALDDYPQNMEVCIEMFDAAHEILKPMNIDPYSTYLSGYDNILYLEGDVY